MTLSMIGGTYMVPFKDLLVMGAETHLHVEVIDENGDYVTVRSIEKNWEGVTMAPRQETIERRRGWFRQGSRVRHYLCHALEGEPGASSTPQIHRSALKTCGVH